MKKMEEVLKEKMKNPDFKREWEALEPEFLRIRENIELKTKVSFSKVYDTKQRKSAVVGYGL